MPIQTITSKSLLDNRIRKSAVWAQLKSYDSFSTFIPGIDKIVVSAKNGSEVKAEWFITIDGAPFTWLEVIDLNEDKFSTNFEAVCGDFDKWYGEWKIAITDEGNYAIELLLNYHLGIPVIEDIVSSILRSKIQLFIDTMTHMHSKNLLSNVCETRNSNRIVINKNVNFVANGIVMDAKVIDISSGGLKMQLQSGILLSDTNKVNKFSFADVNVEGYCISDPHSDIVRIVFTKSLINQDMTSILSRWQTGTLPCDDFVEIYDVITSKTEISKSHSQVS